jgi:hypothetical protein
VGNTLNVVPISQTAEFLLSRSIPCIEANLAKVGVECDRMNLTSARNTHIRKHIPSTPSVAIYFFSNSPVRCRLTKVVYAISLMLCSQQNSVRREKNSDTLPVPPSPTRTSLNVGIFCFCCCCCCCSAMLTLKYCM